jgi:demethylmenaquinone methyltransferase/2-methoxy-6-polyprenyl-1,4-benzoquinol methylase
MSPGSAEEALAERQENVRQLFTRIAVRYDLINDLQSFGLHRYWKRAVIRRAGPLNGKRILDLCCGTGDLAFGLAGPERQVIGLDFTVAMLRQAMVRAEGSKRPVFFVQGDAQQLPFPDCSFDVVTMGYGLRNLADWRKGLSEIHRILVPGGKVLILEFGKPPSPLLRSAYFSYLKFFVPLLGLTFAGDLAAYRYILDSLQRYPGQDGVDQELQRLNFATAEVVNILGGTMSINIGVR